MAGPQMKNRKGAIIVLAAFLTTVVLAMLVVVADFSRIYVQKNDLHTAADAAALAGVAELALGGTDDMVEDSARFYGQQNTVLGQNIVIADADITCGIWNDVAKTYSGDTPNCDFGHNAVTVTTRGTSINSMPGILAGVFPVKTTARAFSAYVGAAKCIKPWAIPYTRLTKTLQPSNPDTLRNIDSVDAEKLKSMTQAERTFMLKIGSPPNSGNFGSLEIPNESPDAPNGGGNLYRYNIATCNSSLIGIGDTINTQTGNMVGPTGQGIKDLCNANGTYDQSTGNCYDKDGNLGIVVKTALWSQGTMKDGGKFAIIVRQIVSFVLENLSNDTEITGHFLPILVVGEITPNPTSLRTAILVK